MLTCKSLLRLLAVSVFGTLMQNTLTAQGAAVSQSRGVGHSYGNLGAVLEGLKSVRGARLSSTPRKASQRSEDRNGKGKGQGKKTTPIPTTTQALPDLRNVLDCTENLKSETRPTSVHALKPGDFDVVAAMGDSVTAGAGASARSIFGVLNDYRGQSFSIGGDESLADGVTTLANILRVVNPNIKGFSTGSGSESSRGAELNVAVSGATVQDMPRQANDLVNKIRNDRDIDMENDWKLVSIFVGANNICDFCEDPTYHSASNYGKAMLEALDILEAQLPRTLVNVMEVINVAPITQVASTRFICSLVVGNICPCAYGVNADSPAIDSLTAAYQSELRDLVNSGRYDNKQDFAVVVQPFFRNTTPPQNPNGSPDMSFFAPDCFHWSEKGHRAAGTALWNNMLEPLNSKNTELGLGDTPGCPTTEFIPTRGN